MILALIFNPPLTIPNTTKISTMNTILTTMTIIMFNLMISIMISIMSSMGHIITMSSLSLEVLASNLSTRHPSPACLFRLKKGHTLRLEQARHRNTSNGPPNQLHPNRSQILNHTNPHKSKVGMLKGSWSFRSLLGFHQS